MFGKWLNPIAKMQNLSQSELNQVAEMHKQSRDELEQIAKMGGIKNYETMLKEQLITSLLKSKDSIAELFNNNLDCMFLSCHVRVFRVNPHSILA